MVEQQHTDYIYLMLMLCGTSWDCSPKFRLLRNRFYSGIRQQQEICACKNHAVSPSGDGQDRHAAGVPSTLHVGPVLCVS